MGMTAFRDRDSLSIEQIVLDYVAECEKCLCVSTVYRFGISAGYPLGPCTFEDAKSFFGESLVLPAG